ncbi:HNH endonuclease [Acinetobacter lwoffii]|jgi:hypothetical protein|uniref:HNH endonuclease n=1 Tax=Acinetobacter lwoffii TaxID=28090 RepID=UPI0038927FFC
MSKNKYGLGREIPASIKREVRKRDGFGCVFCAVPIIEYEHVDPTFIEAKEHKSSGITLLCPTCHAKVTKNQISKELVKQAMANPAALKNGQVRDELRFTDNHPTVVVGGATFRECNIPIQFRDHEIISIKREDDKFFLNANLWDRNGRKTLKIVNNEWTTFNENIWDLTIVGNTITIHEKERLPALIFKIENNNTFRIERIDMVIDGCKISGNANVLEVNGIRMMSCSMNRCHIGMFIG